MAIDTKYGRVQLERGTIGEDEPVVVFRAQDATLPALLNWYLGHCVAKGSPECHLTAVEDARQAVIDWQRDHPTQVPQSAGYDSHAEP